MQSRSCSVAVYLYVSSVPFRPPSRWLTGGLGCRSMVRSQLCGPPATATLAGENGNQIRSEPTALSRRFVENFTELSPPGRSDIAVAAAGPTGRLFKFSIVFHFISNWSPPALA